MKYWRVSKIAKAGAKIAKGGAKVGVKIVDGPTMLLVMAVVAVAVGVTVAVGGAAPVIAAVSCVFYASAAGAAYVCRRKAGAIKDAKDAKALAEGAKATAVAQAAQALGGAEIVGLLTGAAGGGLVIAGGALLFAGAVVAVGAVIAVGVGTGPVAFGVAAVSCVFFASAVKAAYVCRRKAGAIKDAVKAGQLAYAPAEIGEIAPDVEPEQSTSKPPKQEKCQSVGGVGGRLSLLLVRGLLRS